MPQVDWTRPIIAGLDLETTGLKWDKGDKIIEIAISLYDAVTRDCYGSYVRRIYPERNVPDEVTAIHGITYDDLVGCPTFNKVAQEICAILKRVKLVVAHNGEGFDRPFLNYEINQTIANWKASEPPWFDTKLGTNWATATGKEPRLKELAFALDEEYDEAKAHAALYDVGVMMRCLFKGVDYGFIQLPEGVSP